MKYILDHLLELITLSLVVVTYLYVIYSKKMAKNIEKQTQVLQKQTDILLQEYKLKTKIISSFCIDCLRCDKNEIIIYVIAINEGQFPIYLKKASLYFNSIDQRKTIYEASRSFRTLLKERGGNYKEMFRFSLIDIPEYKMNKISADNIYISYKYYYSDLENNHYIYEANPKDYIYLKKTYTMSPYKIGIINILYNIKESFLNILKLK